MNFGGIDQNRLYVYQKWCKTGLKIGNLLLHPRVCFSECIYVYKMFSYQLLFLKPTIDITSISVFLFRHENVLVELVRTKTP